MNIDDKRIRKINHILNLIKNKRYKKALDKPLTYEDLYILSHNQDLKILDFKNRDM